MSRRFNRRQRSALYLASDGLCEQCGELLSSGWHADHSQPWSRGGETDVTNGQALCPKCNLKKGNRMVIALRPFQQHFIESAVAQAESGKRVVIGDIHPGGGKTLAYLAAADTLMRMKVIDRVAVYVPRINLAKQVEEDWAKFRNDLPWTATMRRVDWRGNTPPLIRGNADGYVTTYDSLISEPDLHLHAVSSSRTLVIFDEAQQLGVDYDESSTRSAEIAERIGEAARMVFVVSGTMYRADGSELLFAKYDEPDEYGFRKLISHVDVQYLDGVRDGYLRPFEAILHDGQATWQIFGRDAQRLQLSDMERSIYKVICEPGYWRGLVDRVIERVMEVKATIDPDLRGLIAARDIKHARAVTKYIKDKYPHVRTLTAVSEDGAEAHESLSRFRAANSADVLVTVQMAYVGYDCKQITVLGILTSYRTEGYLRQLMARGLRVLKDIPVESQTCYAIVPDDQPMREFVEKLRRESQAGVLERERKQREQQERQRLEQQELGYSLDGQVTAIHARGIDPTGDISAEQWPVIEQIRQKHHASDPATKIMAMLKDFGSLIMPKPKQQSSEVAYQSRREQEEAARSELKKLANKCDYQHFSGQFGETNKALWQAYQESVERSDLDGILRRMATVNRWIENGYDWRQ